MHVLRGLDSEGPCCEATGEAELAPQELRAGSVRNRAPGPGSRASSPRKGAGVGRRCPGAGGIGRGGDARMLALPRGALGWSLVTGAQGDGRGALGRGQRVRVHKLRREPENRLLGTKLGLFSSPAVLAGEESPGVHWPFLNADYHDQAPWDSVGPGSSHSLLLSGFDPSSLSLT